MLLLFIGTIVAILLGDVIELGFCCTLSSQIISSQLVFGFIVVSSSMTLFGSDTLIRGREETGGIVLFSLVLGKVFASFVETIIFPLAFTTGYYSLLKPMSSFKNYWYTFILLQMALSGYCNVFVVLTRGKGAVVINGLLVILWAFAGIDPSRQDIYERLSVFGQILNYASPFSASHRLAVKKELNEYSDVFLSNKKKLADKYILGSYSPSFNTESEAGYLLLYWFISNILTYLILVFQRDDYRMWKLFAKRTGVYYIQRCFAYCLHRIETVVVDTNGAIEKCLKSKSNRKTDDNETKIEVPRSKSDIVQSDYGITRQANIVIN
jgi:hypothetical protein